MTHGGRFPDNGGKPVHRHGLALLELLVYFAIVGVLVSLLLVAVQRTRESARQVACISNLRQIAIASDLYLTRTGHFVSNGWGFNWGPDHSRGLGPTQPAGWIYQLAFGLDPAAAESFSRSSSSDQPHPYLVIVRCPTRPGPHFGPVGSRLSPINYVRSQTAPKTDYAINEGDYVTRTLGGPASDDPSVITQYDWSRGSLATGISSQRSRVRPAMVLDGLSHTYLVGEKHVFRDAYYSGEDPGYDQSCWSGVDLDLNRWTNTAPIPDHWHSRGRQFGSAHPGVWHITFCDGSVRKFTFDIDVRVHQMHGHRADSGQVVSDPFGG